MSLFRYSSIVFNCTLSGTVSGRTSVLLAVRFNTKHLVFQLLQRPLSLSRHLNDKSAFANLSLNRGCLEQGATNVSLIF